MTRRWLLASLLGMAGCSLLPDVPYTERRDWPLMLRRSVDLPPRRGGAVLLVRSMAAAPGLEARGLRWLLHDGSLHVDFYEQWAVPPAQAVEDSMRQYLAGSGLFAAVLGPGSRMSADLVLETELLALMADLGSHSARASLALVLLDQRVGRTRVLLQETVTGEAPLAGKDPAMLVGALRTAVAEALRKAEAAIAVAVRVQPARRR